MRTFKSFCLLAVSLPVLLVGEPFLSNSAMAANCEDALNNNIYVCLFKSDFGSEFVDVFAFVSPGTQSEDFDALIDSLSTFPLGCECKARGRIRNPKFDSSKSFHCVLGAAGVADTGFAISFEGKVNRKGNKIKKGEAVNDTGNSFVYECERVEALDARLREPSLRNEGNPWLGK